MDCSECLDCALYIDNKSSCSDRMECEKCKTKLCTPSSHPKERNSTGHYYYNKKRYCMKCWNNPPKIKGVQ